MMTSITSEVANQVGFVSKKNTCDLTTNVNMNTITSLQITEEKCENIDTCDISNKVDNTDEKIGANFNQNNEAQNGEESTLTEQCVTGVKGDIKNGIDHQGVLNVENIDVCDSVNDNNTRDLKKKRLLILDSDSEEESIFISATKGKTNKINDDDSDSKDSDHCQNKTVISSGKSQNTRRHIDSDSEDDTINNTSHVIGNTLKKKSVNVSQKLRELVDSESESEDEDNKISSAAEKGSTIIEPVKKPSKSKNEKKRKGSLRASKNEAMKQIHSETQRLLREREVSLPYHRPKQRSLQEFLNRRKVAPTLPQAPTIAAKLKMSSEFVSKILEEKEKEAEEFYKSSDSENETVENDCNSRENIVPPKNVNTDNCLSNIEKIGIEETQKVVKNNVQNAHNKKEILQQGSVGLGVPRQLFGKSFDAPLSNDLESVVNEVDDKVEDCEENGDEQKRPSKQHKHGLKDVSNPRKLFNTLSEMDADDVSSREENPQTVQESVAEIFNVNNDDDKQEEAEISNEINEPTDTLMKDVENTNALKISETPHIDSTEIIKRKQDSINTSVQKESQDTLTSKDKSSEANDIDMLDNIETNSQQTDSRELTKDFEQLDGHVRGLPLPDIEDDKPSANIDFKKIIMSSMPNMKPKLKGIPGMMIDLSGNLKPNRQGINTLIDRFCKHTAIPKPSESVTDVSVIRIEETINGLLPVKESLPYRVPSVANEDPELSKPGAKLLRLKEDLKLQMAMKRNEEWKEKEKQQKAEEENDLDGYDMEEYDELKAKEKSKNIELSESGESEPEEEDMPIKEKKRIRRDFAIEEAEVSDDEQDEDEESEDGELENDNDEMDGKNTDEEVEEEEDVEVGLEDECETGVDDNSSDKKKRKFKRILTSFDDESNGTNTKDCDDETSGSRKIVFERSKTDVDMFESCNGNDAWSANNDTSTFQPNAINAEPTDESYNSPQVKSKDLFSFVSPITQLTALKCSSSAQKTPSNVKDLLLIDESTSAFVENTPTKKSGNVCSFKKTIDSRNKLFDILESPPNEEELMQLCSGKFSNTQESDLPALPAIGSTAKSNISDSQLLGLCSGTFSTQPSNNKILEKVDVQTQNENSQDIKLFLDENSISPAEKVKEKIKSEISEAPWSKFRIVSSDDEEDAEKTEQSSKKIKKLKKKKVKKLQLSDDEEGSDDEDSEKEDDFGDSDEENLNVQDEEKYMDYDSEENEIIVTKKTIKQVAAGFVEDEAELSESEWGSADEDEKDLDKLEIEDGDDEEIDENQMKNQLEKIHMRQILDDDQREVRLLKELLFEDGDLHTEGDGRERKFKWRNIDKLGEENDNLGSIDDIDNLEDNIEAENDIEQIKLRHEREKFLQERKEKSDDDLENELGDSEIFMFGMKALKKINKTKSKKEDNTDSPVQSEDRLFPKTVSDILNSKNSGKKTQALYRHSLLARGEETLARIAKIVKETDVTSVGKKPSKFCIFTTVSPVKKDKNESDEVERVEEGNSTKKSSKRKAPKSGTARSAKRSKLEENEMIRKALFD